MVAIHINVSIIVETPKAHKAFLKPTASAISDPKNKIGNVNPVPAINIAISQPEVKSFGCTLVVVY